MMLIPGGRGKLTAMKILSRILDKSPLNKLLPVIISRIISVLVFKVFCRSGPITIAGFITKRSKSLSFTKSHAAFSASVFET